ncbi:peptide-methionine (S)-S-oxide reductase MsrA [Salisediminibacterium beveridgei]|uniref:Peptide methionine sulfoxide reductase MsrA n=1 Tax=Salisediminibacterium beveridgei TaxID=632773 RepID=A0A1D7QVD6_9BACI|nr:peptide-methionine (S)-S-oxide reductase MsrA [Salisediminibacterium beveridgei]AOM82973.1 Peptide methionine sulfoxide reductase MsrA [Salisediminibacterium beveridgei]
MSNIEKATFAGGCFWCMVKPFEELPGIIEVISGYMGGHLPNPTYEQVKSGTSGHREVVQITFDREKFPYSGLLDLYWPQIDPTDPDGQFIDRGEQYRTAIYYHNEDQRQAAVLSKRNLDENGPFKDPVVTDILPAEVFYPAEEEHQKFHQKNPEAYKDEQTNSGRQSFIQNHWQGHEDL